MRTHDEAEGYWLTVATCRPVVIRLLTSRYAWPVADCEDAVSLAALRMAVLHDIHDIQGYLYRVSQHILLHQRRVDARHTQLRTTGGADCVLPSVNPARWVQAAHDLTYYLSLLSPTARDRLLLTHTLSLRECARIRKESVNTIKVSNYRARHVLTQDTDF